MLLQLSLCRSKWNGCVKVSRCCGWVRNTILQLRVVNRIVMAASAYTMLSCRHGCNNFALATNSTAATVACRSFRWPVGLRHLLVGLQNLRAGGLFSLTPDAARLPYGLMHLHLGDRCKWSLQQIGLPAELQHLEMGYSFAQPICNIRWPRRLQTLTYFGMTFNRPLQDVLLPATLCELHSGNHFDQALAGIRWPSQVRLLHFGSDFNHSLATANLPDQPEPLVLGRFFQQDLRTCLCRNHCCVLPLANAFRWNDIRCFGCRTWRNWASSGRFSTFRSTSFCRRPCASWIVMVTFWSVAERSREEERTAALPAFATPRCIPVARTAVLLACPSSFGLSGSRTQSRVRLCCSRALLTNGCSWRHGPSMHERWTHR